MDENLGSILSLKVIETAVGTAWMIPPTGGSALTNLFSAMAEWDSIITAAAAGRSKRGMRRHPPAGTGSTIVATLPGRNLPATPPPRIEADRIVAGTPRTL